LADENISWSVAGAAQTISLLQHFLFDFALSSALCAQQGAGGKIAVCHILPVHWHNTVVRLNPVLPTRISPIRKYDKYLAMLADIEI
jgi:hypothetical protein